jgi:PLD-like domain
MAIQVGGIELFMGPTALGAPDDLEAVIKQFIAGAKRSLFIAVQELDSRPVAEAILAAKAAKLKVRMILEGDYLVEDPPLADPWAISGANETNRLIHSALLRAGVDLISDLNPAIFHQKFIVRDPGEPSAAVLTGSTNFTLTDTGMNTPGAPGADPAQVGNNLNHLVILHGSRATTQYLAEFDRMRDGTFGDRHERVESRPAEFSLGKVRVKPLFAPQQGPEIGNHEADAEVDLERGLRHVHVCPVVRHRRHDDPAGALADPAARRPRSGSGDPAVGGDAAAQSGRRRTFREQAWHRSA